MILRNLFLPRLGLIIGIVVVLAMLKINFSFGQTMATNPIIWADVPDPDFVRVGDTYYMSSTTMYFNPGIPIMKSKDLVNWSLVSYCYPTLANTNALNLNGGLEAYSGGTWASSINYRNGTFYVSSFSYSTGKTYIFKTTDIENGPWTTITLNKVYHDHSLFFDDDGKVYFAYGHDDIWLTELKPDLTGEQPGGVNKIIINKASSVAGTNFILTAEGTRLQKINGLYYVSNICWPSGRGRTQIIHRSNAVAGSYTGRVVFQSSIGSAQGEYIDTPDGKWYAMFFHDHGSVGRIPDLMPVTWSNGWPTVGVNGQVPATLDILKGTGTLKGIIDSDEFSQAPPLKLQWQWNHNPNNNYWSLSQRSGFIRFTNERTDANVLRTTNTLTQRTYGPKSTGYIAIDVSGMKDGDYTGLVALQNKYGFVGVKMSGTTKNIVMVNGTGFNGTPSEVVGAQLNQNMVYLRIDMDFTNRTDKAYFHYSLDSETWHAIGGTLQMTYDLEHFTGYRFGLFSFATKSSGGYVDYDFFRVGANITEAKNVGPSVSFTSPTNGLIFSAGSTISLAANARTPNGSISNVKFYNGTTLLATDNTAAYSYNWTNVPAGTYTIRAVATDNQGKIAETTITIKVNVPQGPYNGTVHIIPGTIQAEAFDVGGNGFAYLDNTPGSAVTPVVNFRTNEDVDIENCTDAGGGYNIGYATAGEWLEYSVNVQTTSIYTMNLRIACQGDARTISVSMDGANIASNVAIPNTTGWQTWQTVSVNNISLTAGQKIMRITIGATDYVNLNSVTFALSSPPVATITAAGVTTFCMGGSVVLNASTGSDYTYQWKRDGNNNIANATSSSYTATQSGSYTVTVSANSQTATSTAISVSVNAIPGAPVVSSPLSYCENAIATQLIATGSSLKWYTLASGGTSSATAPTPSTSVAGTTNYYVSQTTNGCESSRATIAVNVNALPVITPYAQLNAGAWLQQNTAQLCAGGSVMLGPQPVSTTGWSWTGPSGFTSASREILFANISLNQSGVYTASYTSNGCTSTHTFNITVNNLPDAPSVNPQVTYCLNATASQLTATGTGLKWYTVLSGGTSSSTEPTPSTITTGTTNHYVSQTVNGCESSRATIAVRINAIPGAPSVNPQVTYCENATASQLSATGAGLKWYTAPSGGTSSSTAPTPPTVTVGTTNHYVSQTVNGCESSRATIAVKINAIPGAPSVNSPINYCQDAAASQLSATGTGLKWYTALSGGTSSSTAPTSPTATVGTTNHYVSQTVNGCEGSRARISVNVNELPNAIITPTGPTTFVEGGSVTLNANSGPGLSYKWFNGTMQVGTVTSYTATSTGSYAVEVTNDASGCKATSSATYVSANGNQPSVISIVSPTSNSTVNGPITFTVTVSDPDGGITSVEYLDGTTVIGTSTSSPYSFTWDNPTAGDHVITVRVTDSNGGVTTSSPVTVTSNTTTGIQDIAEMQGLVYPNPASGEMTIETAMDLSNARVTVINVLGEEIQLPSTMNGRGASIDVSDLAEGTYLMIIKNESSLLRKKISVVR